LVTGITPTELDLKSLTGICIAGGVSSVLIICILFLLKVCCRSSDEKSSEKDLGKRNSNSMEALEKDPDIIPHKEGK